VTAFLADAGYPAMVPVKLLASMGARQWFAAYCGRVGGIRLALLNRGPIMRIDDKTPFDERSLPVAEDAWRDERIERIAVRAFEIYEARGGEDGRDIDDWLRAEEEIDDEIRKDDQIEGLDREG